MRCALVLIALVASHADDGPYGTLGNTCYETGVCNAGLVCVDQTCVAEPPSIDGGRPVPPDAEMSVECGSDEAIEPNDTPAQAWVSPIPSFAECITLVDLALCPEGDVDAYRFSVEVNGKSVRAVARYALAFGSVDLRVLNASGTVIANGALEDAGTVVVEVNNLAVGTYYIDAALSGPDIVTNYDLDIFTCDGAPCTATPMCP
jgi:hypothetical protein